MKEVKCVGNYIDKLQFKDNVPKDLITVEHRSNNPKRDYLFVNRIQGKHIPSSPTEFINMVYRLVNEIVPKVSNERVLVIGFAETATAIGNLVASELFNSVYYLQTTREQFDTEPLVVFEEKHSHAVEQAIYSQKSLNEIDFTYILFVEDEVSTGKTILNCIEQLSTKVSKVKYGVASICNWQDSYSIETFNIKGIDRFYLVSGELKDEQGKMGVQNSDIERCNTIDSSNSDTIPDRITLITNQYKNERQGYCNYDTKKLVDILASFMVNASSLSDRILVLGTEEFMYIPLMTAHELENRGFYVRCHSNTRSSIDIIRDSKNKGSELVSKFKIPSAYDNSRDTYIYNLEYYDRIFIISDATTPKNFLIEISKVLNSFGISTEKITLLLVGEESKEWSI